MPGPRWSRLTVLEIVLGIDNVIFISVLVSRCSAKEAKRARQIGLSLALIFRIILLFALTWLMGADAAARDGVRHRRYRGATSS